MKREQREDLSTLNTFNKCFIKECLNQFPEGSLYQGREFKAYLGYGADIIYRSNIQVPEMSPVKAKRIGLVDRTLLGMIWLDSEINPNGVTDKSDIARTYTIQIKFFGKRKHTQRRWEVMSDFISYYNYALTPEQAINYLKCWLKYCFEPFLQDVRTGKYHWQKNYNRCDRIFKQKVRPV